MSGKKFNFTSYKNKEKFVACMLTLPVLLIYFVFVFWPVLNGMANAFTDFSVFNPNPKFVFLSNFETLFFQTDFFIVIIRTLLFVLLVISFQYVFGLIFAMLLDLELPYTSGLRNFVMLPWVLPITSTVLLFNWIFQADYGLINIFLRAVGREEWVSYWFGSTKLALPAVSIIHIWRNVPFYGIVLYAGLKSIPKELYEAANIDGASFWSTLFRIKLPLIKKQSISIILLHVIFTYNNVDIILLSTGGGPVGITNMLGINAYNLVWGQYQFGVGTASSIIMFLILVPIALASIRFSNKEN